MYIDFESADETNSKSKSVNGGRILTAENELVNCCVQVTVLWVTIQKLVHEVILI